MSGFNGLSGYVEEDAEKRKLLEQIRPKPCLSKIRYSKLKSYDFIEDSVERNVSEEFLEADNIEIESDVFIDEDESDEEYVDYDFDLEECFEIKEFVLEAPKLSIKPSKICPECGREFFEENIHCPDCLVMLKSIDDNADIIGIVSNPKIEFIGGSNSFDDSQEMLSEANIDKVTDFDFTMDDFSQIMRSIKAQGFNNLSDLVKKHQIDMESLDIKDKVILIAKSFVPVEYKAYGEDLGYFEFDKIYIDDRQLDSLLITTVIHELTHFFMKEILTQVLCRLLDMTKTPLAEALITYILSYSTLNKLIDEYAAHSVEGRFTVFGYQDYSSFMALQGNLDEADADIAKTIGNTFSIHIKDMLEAFINRDLRDEIKDQFIHDTTEMPDYRRLRFESSSKLIDDGFLKAIWLILCEGIRNVDLDKVIEYERHFN